MTERLRIGFVGVHRASSFFSAFRAHPATEIVALCDLHRPTLEEAGRALAVSHLFQVYEEMLEQVELDAVVIASPMQHHAGQAILALQRDIHVLSEVTACVSIDEARWLAQACAQSRGVYMMAENYIYRKPVALVHAMVQAGLFGEVYYAEGEYIHELSKLHRTADGAPTWRYYWQVGVNGATYPTHSLGPCLQWIGERPARISCIGTGERTAPQYKLPEHKALPGRPAGGMEDTVLLLCKTTGEKLIRIRVDMLSRRPHAMTNYALQGTKGAYESARRPGEGDWVWVADYCDDPDRWVPLAHFEDEYLPPIWRNPPPEALAAGHGGGDYFEVMDFVDAIRGEKPPPIDIHRALDMTLPGLVSQESIRQGGAWLDVPDSRRWVAGD